MDRERFKVDLLDREDPFEIDNGNRPHLYKHLPMAEHRPVSVGIEDILDAYLVGNPLFYPGSDEGEADWIMIAEAPGIVLAVPLAPPQTLNPSKCRPIGLDSASNKERERYISDLAREDI